jgi:hypothetical protein
MGQLHFEVPAGIINGVNTVFSVSVPYVAGSTAVWINGALMERALDDGWLESNPATGEVTLKEAPRGSGACPDVIQVFFKDTPADLPEVVITEICGTVEMEVGLCGYLVQEEGNLIGTISEYATISGLLMDEEPQICGVLEPADDLIGVIVGEECL